MRRHGLQGAALGAVIVLAAAVLVFCHRAALLRSGPETGLPLDDAWIHMRFAMNLEAGEGLSFNPGQASAGATAPLWVLLLAALPATPQSPAVPSALLSAAFHVLVCVLAALLALRLARQVAPAIPSALRAGVALAAGSSTALCGRYAWSGLAGMEIGLAACLQLLSLLVLVPWQPGESSRRPLAAAALGGLAVLARPEALLLLVLLLAAVAAAEFRRRRYRRALWPVLAGCLPVLPWALYCLALTGRPLPATFQPNKGGLGLPDPGYLQTATWQLATDNLVAAGLALAATVALLLAACRGRNAVPLLPGLLVLAFPLAAAMVAPNLRHHGRYTMPLIPVISALAAAGAVWPARRGAAGSFPGRGVVLAAAALLLLPAGALPALPGWVRTFGWDVQNIQHQHVAVGRWLAGHAGEGCHVATHDIGAIGVLSRCRVTDLIGLVSPEIARLYVELPDPRRRDPEIRRLLGATGVTHVVVYPRWFPSLAGDPALEEVAAVTLQRLAAAGERRMVIYRTPGPGPW